MKTIEVIRNNNGLIPLYTNPQNLNTKALYLKRCKDLRQLIDGPEYASERKLLETLNSDLGSAREVLKNIDRY